MFKGAIIWKGMIYALLMAFAKSLVCLVIYFEFFSKKFKTKRFRKTHKAPLPSNPIQTHPIVTAPAETTRDINQNPDIQGSPPHTAALLLSFAMISRGEIGFLIASLSLTSGTLTLDSAGGTSQSSTELFLILIWAIVLCTLVGPIAVGWIIRRSDIKTLGTDYSSNVEMSLRQTTAENRPSNLE
jgi:hypothetical protein